MGEGEDFLNDIIKTLTAFVAKAEMEPGDDLSGIQEALNKTFAIVWDSAPEIALRWHGDRIVLGFAQDLDANNFFDPASFSS